MIRKEARLSVEHLPVAACVGSSKNLKDLEKGGCRDRRHEGQKGRTELIRDARGPEICKVWPWEHSGRF